MRAYEVSSTMCPLQITCTENTCKKALNIYQKNTKKEKFKMN